MTDLVEGTLDCMLNCSEPCDPTVTTALVQRASSFTMRVDQPRLSRDVRITLEIPRDGERISLMVYDARGRRVRRLVDGNHARGTHVIPWDGTDDRGGRLASGVYFLRASDGRVARTGRVLFVR